MTIRILIADDHPIVRTGIRGVLAGNPDFEVVAEAENGQQAIDLIKLKTVDVILMDLRMPTLDGVSAIQQIKALKPSIYILVLTTYDTDYDILTAVNAGASGYLLKDVPRDELYQAIKTVSQGGSVLKPEIASRLLNHMRHPTHKLSEREIDVIRLVANGLTNKEIGQTLHISESTVKTHLNHIYGKLNVPDRASAVSTVIAMGLIAPD